jgi:uncharacterized protein YecE (DUF72 family)
MQEQIFESNKFDDHNGLLKLGTSGWSYKDWVGSFYPARTPSTKWLAHYASKFNVVEVDSTFYAIPPKERLVKWRETVPAGFEFALKVPKVITHEKSLVDCNKEMTAFLNVCEGLEEKLGPILFQFPNSFKPERLEDLLVFLDRLPASDYLFAVEIRNRNWYQGALADELTERKIPLVMVDHPWMPREPRVTGRFAYIRWLGDQDALEVFDRIQLDKDKELRWWAEETVGLMRKSIPVYGFFNNHFRGHSPSDVIAFADLLAQMRDTG